MQLENIELAQILQNKNNLVKEERHSIANTRRKKNWRKTKLNSEEAKAAFLEQQSR